MAHKSLISEMSLILLAPEGYYSLLMSPEGLWGISLILTLPGVIGSMWCFWLNWFQFVRGERHSPWCCAKVSCLYLPRLPTEIKLFRISSSWDVLEVWFSHWWEILQGSHGRFWNMCVEFSHPWNNFLPHSVNIYRIVNRSCFCKFLYNLSV